MPPTRVRRGRVRPRMLSPLLQNGRPVPPGCATVECGLVRLRSCCVHHGCVTLVSWCPTHHLVLLIGESVDVSMSHRAVECLSMMGVLLGSDLDAWTEPSHIIQTTGLFGARVTSPPSTTWMQLASDMRARCASDRFRPHAHGHGALAGGECAVAPSDCRPPLRTDRPSTWRPGLQVEPTSV